MQTMKLLQEPFYVMTMAKNVHTLRSFLASSHPL